MTTVCAHDAWWLQVLHLPSHEGQAATWWLMSRGVHAGAVHTRMHAAWAVTGHQDGSTGVPAWVATAETQGFSDARSMHVRCTFDARYDARYDARSGKHRDFG